MEELTMITVYIGFILALLANLGIGRRLLKIEGFTAILGSLLVVAGVISPMAYYRVNLIKYVLLLWTACGLLLLIYDAYHAKEKLLSNGIKKQYFYFGAVFVFFLIYFRNVNSSNYVYESHDLVYFSWIQDFLRADYEGALRISVSWPNIMASNHLLPGAVISALSVFVVKPTLITTIELKYIFLALYFSSLVLAWAKARQVSIAIIMGIFISMFAIYGQEIGYNLRISSFLYLVVLTELIKAVFLGGRDREIVFFAFFLIIAKAPIFFVAGVAAVWYLYKSSHQRLSASTFTALTLVLVNIATWHYAPKSTTIQTNISLASPLSLHTILALKAVQDWFIHDIAYDYLMTFSSLPIITLLLLIYIWIKFYAGYFLLTPMRRLREKGNYDLSVMSRRDRLIGIDLYVCTSLFAWIFVRYGGQINHVVHAYILMSFLTCFTVADYIICHLKIKNLIICFITVIIYGLSNNPADPFYYTNKGMRSSTSAVTLTTLGEPRIINDFYIPAVNEPPAVSQVKAAMFGYKLDSNKTPSPPDSQITDWVIKNEY